MLKNQRGFTIIELLLVLLGAVLFASMGLYTLRARDKMSLAMTARGIQSLIRESQDRAYGEQETYEIDFYPTSGECVQIKKHRAIKDITMPSGITMMPTNFPRGNLRFSGKLRPSGGGTIELYSRSDKIEITVLPVTGRVKIYPIQRR